MTFGKFIIWFIIYMMGLLGIAFLGYGIYRVLFPRAFFLGRVTEEGGEKAILKLFSKYGSDEAIRILCCKLSRSLNFMDVSRGRAIERTTEDLKNESLHLKNFINKSLTAAEELGKQSELAGKFYQRILKFYERQSKYLIARETEYLDQTIITQRESVVKNEALPILYTILQDIKKLTA